MQELNHHPKGEIETEASYLNDTSESCQLANPPTPRNPHSKASAGDKLWTCGLSKSSEQAQACLSHHLAYNCRVHVASNTLMCFIAGSVGASKSWGAPFSKHLNLE